MALFSKVTTTVGCPNLFLDTFEEVKCYTLDFELLVTLGKQSSLLLLTGHFVRQKM